MPRILAGLMLPFILCVPTIAWSTGWYVDGANGKPTNSGTAASPFRGAQQAMAVARPGDTIYLLPTAIYGGISITTSGTAAKPITVTGTGLAPNLTKALGKGNNSAVWINANYVVLQNLDVSAPGQYSGILIENNRHHVTIASNVAHDCGAAGIQAIANDYVRISHNVIYGNAHDTTGSRQNSGISLLGFVDIDTSTGTKNVIDGNIVYANTNIPNCTTAKCLATAEDSDGSGIILDSFLKMQFAKIPYGGRTLISNNVVFGNGGRGIFVYDTNHVSIIDNTVWSNNQDPYEGAWHPGEVGLLEAGDVSVYNNIFYSDGKMARNIGGTTPNVHYAVNVSSSQNHAGPINVHHNILFNTKNDPSLTLFTRYNTGPVLVTGNFWKDPKLKFLSLNAAVADFRPGPSSPALNNGDPANAVKSDINSVLRTGKTTIGAYETTLN